MRTLPASPTLLTDAMPQMVWSTRPDGYHDYFNARWYEFTGVDVGATDGSKWVGMFHPDDQPETRRRWAHSLATGEPYEAEYRLRHRDGEWRWTLGRALPVRTADGTIIRWIGTCTDIDAQKRAEQQLSLITHELNHRIKNIFSVIGGLVALSARNQPEAAEFARELQARIGALGRAHELSQPGRQMAGDAATGTLHLLLRQLFAPYPALSEGRIILSGDDLPIADAAITPLSLLFHELATNAVKYGALSTAEGRLMIETAHDGAQVRIIWRENGGPPLAQPPAHQGFGSELADVTVRRQLGGEIRHDWPAEGAKITLTLAHSRLTAGQQASSQDGISSGAAS